MKHFEVLILSTAVTFLLTNCAHKSLNTSDKKPSESKTPKSVKPLNFPVTLKLIGEKGREELTSNCSVSSTKSFLNGNLEHERIEGLDFKVKTLTTEILKNGNLSQTMESVSKDGSGSLHDLAYPEVGEVLDIEITPGGTVKKAGHYKRDSIFFVAPLPLPSYPVKPGDNWEMKSSWNSEESGIPLTVTIHARLIGSVICGEHNCVNITVQGDVHMPKDIEKKNGFGHRLSGRFLFDPERGLLTWSEFLSDEHLQAKGARVEVHSVLRSELTSPLGYHIANHEEPSCPIETKAE